MRAEIFDLRLEVIELNTQNAKILQELEVIDYSLESVTRKIDFSHQTTLGIVQEIQKINNLHCKQDTCSTLAQ